MKNSDLPAFPLPREIAETLPNVGLTKREYFAAMAMQAIATGVFSGNQKAYIRQLEDWMDVYGPILVREAIAKDAVKLADELLKQLES